MANRRTDLDAVFLYLREGKYPAETSTNVKRCIRRTAKKNFKVCKMVFSAFLLCNIACASMHNDIEVTFRILPLPSCHVELAQNP